jgi:hypothetical protein
LHFTAGAAEQESGADWNQFAGGSCTRWSPAPCTAHCYANHNTALRKTWSVSFQQSPIVSQNLENGMSLLRVGGSHVGFEPTTYVVDDIWRDVLVGKLQFRVNTYRRASSNQFGRRMQRKDVMEETLCVRFGVVVIVETQVHCSCFGVAEIRLYHTTTTAEKVRREVAGLQRMQLPPGNWFAPPDGNRVGCFSVTKSTVF